MRCLGLTLASLARCSIELRRLASRDTQRLPCARAEMFRQKDDLADMVRVMYELAVDRFDH
jgi:hypothetical protein